MAQLHISLNTCLDLKLHIDYNYNYRCVNATLHIIT